MAYWYTLWPIGIIYGHLVLCMAVVVCGPLVYFSRFGLFEPRKIWQLCPPLELSICSSLARWRKHDWINRKRLRFQPLHQSEWTSVPQPLEHQ
jgi:hypothetical protein